MRSTIKRFAKSAIMATPSGHQFFERIEALRSQNEQLSEELAIARSRIAAIGDLAGEKDVARARVLQLESEIGRAAEEVRTLRGTALRDKREALQLLARKGFVPDLVVDVGAAGATVGLYETWPDAHYILIEPLEKYRQPLLDLCKSFASAEVLTAAVGAATGELRLAAHPTDPHRLAPQQSAPPGWIHFSVPMVTVDSLIAKARTRGQVTSSVIKIDVDGPEIAVLNGAEASLAEGRDVYILEAALLDTDRGRFGEIVNHMTARGYEVLDIIEPLFRPADQVLWQVDLVFVPRGAAARSERTYC